MYTREISAFLFLKVRFFFFYGEDTTVLLSDWLGFIPGSTTDWLCDPMEVSSPF